jgi:hypothetical protein
MLSTKEGRAILDKEYQKLLLLTKANKYRHRLNEKDHDGNISIENSRNSSVTYASLKSKETSGKRLRVADWRLAEDLLSNLWDAVLDSEGVPKEERLSLVAKLRIEIARAVRPKWAGRLERGGPLAPLSAPTFLKEVHKSDIAADGTVQKEIIRAVDPELMKAVEVYISRRKTRNLDLGDAAGLNFVLERPGSKGNTRAARRSTEPR